MKFLKSNPFLLGVKRFSFHRGTTFAAASSFYLLLTIVPLILILVRFIGMFLGDLSAAFEQVFLLTQKFFPYLTGDFVVALKELVSTALFGSVELTLINIFILLIGSLSFLNSLWNGVYLITQDRSFISWGNYLRNLMIFGFSILFLIAVFLIPIFSCRWNRLKKGDDHGTILNKIDKSKK